MSSLELPNLAPTYAAVPGGNLTGNGFSLLHHTFGIIFCGNEPGGDGACPSFGGEGITDVTFSYLPNINDLNYVNAEDFGSTHPEWVAEIKNGALNAYKAAFASLPAIVKSGASPTMQYGGSNNPQFDHNVFVGGWWRGAQNGDYCPMNGITSDFKHSLVYYLSLMCGAQVALGPYGNSSHFSPPTSDTANFQKLVTAIGNAIGNVAAHETGHQLAFNADPFKLTGMDCGTSVKPCENGEDAVYEYYMDSEWNYKDWKPPIHWQPSDQCTLEKYLLNSKTCR
jgi:hypothetical protein